MTPFESLPEIVCMCGSTRFKQTWISENARLTGEGYIVLSVGLWGHHERKYPDAETKEFLDNLHKRKIDLCDWVWILDVGGYIGDSTKDEIEYAKKNGKLIRFLSKEFSNYKESSLFESLPEEVQHTIRVASIAGRLLDSYDNNLNLRLYGRELRLSIEVLWPEQFGEGKEEGDGTIY